MANTISKTVDVQVHSDGTMSHFTPITQKAKDWVEENVTLESWQWLGNGFGVEHRYVDDLVRGMVEGDLVVQIGDQVFDCDNPF